MLRFDILSRWVGRLALLLGLAAAVVYARAGLTLSHYDAKAHLVVSRRILDSITGVLLLGFGAKLAATQS